MARPHIRILVFSFVIAAAALASNGITQYFGSLTRAQMKAAGLSGLQ